MEPLFAIFLVLKVLLPSGEVVPLANIPFSSVEDCVQSAGEALVAGEDMMRGKEWIENGEFFATCSILHKRISDARG